MTHCTLVSVENQVLLDPTVAELQASQVEVSLAYMASRDEVTYVGASGDWGVASLKDCMETCLDGCRKLRQVLRKSLVQEHQGQARSS